MGMEEVVESEFVNYKRKEDWIRHMQFQGYKIVSMSYSKGVYAVGGNHSWIIRMKKS